MSQTTTVVDEPQESLISKINPFVFKKDEWLPNPVRNILAGLLIAFALIPESIAFSSICGVDPKVGLYTSFILAVTTAICGGRPGLIAAATGAQALVVGPMLRAKFDPDQLINKLDEFRANSDTAALAEVAAIQNTIAQHLFLAAVLTGIFQFVGGLAGISKLLKYVPRPVMVGFVNALAILIFKEQFHHFHKNFVAVLILVLVGMAITYVLPMINKAVPAALTATIVLTAVVYFAKIKVPLVKDMGDIPESLPKFTVPTFESVAEYASLSEVSMQSAIWLVAPFALAMMVVGLVESLLSATILDGMTGTRSDKTRECRSQGYGNILSGLFGGMPGCALTGQSIVNTQQGGRTRLSSFTAGAGMLLMILVFSNFVNAIPMAALVSIMIVVCIATFNWRSIFPSQIQKTPVGELVVIVAVMVSSIATGNLGIGVVLGAILSLLFRMNRKRTAPQISTNVADGSVVHQVSGSLHYSSIGGLLDTFEAADEGASITLDLTDAEIHDTTVVAELDGLAARLRDRGHDVHITGLTGESESFYNKLTGTLGVGH